MQATSEPMPLSNLYWALPTSCAARILMLRTAQCLRQRCSWPQAWHRPYIYSWCLYTVVYWFIARLPLHVKVLVGCEWWWKERKTLRLCRHSVCILRPLPSRLKLINTAARKHLGFYNICSTTIPAHKRTPESSHGSFACSSVISHSFSSKAHHIHTSFAWHLTHEKRRSWSNTPVTPIFCKWSNNQRCRRGSTCFGRLSKQVADSGGIRWYDGEWAGSGKEAAQ